MTTAHSGAVSMVNSDDECGTSGNSPAACYQERARLSGRPSSPLLSIQEERTGEHKAKSDKEVRLHAFVLSRLHKDVEQEFSTIIQELNSQRVWRNHIAATSPSADKVVSLVSPAGTSFH